MDSELFKTFGQVAGIGGLALGVFLVLFRDLIRKSIFPTLRQEDAYRLLRLMAVLVWTVALVGIAAWAWTEMRSAGTVSHSIVSNRDIHVGGDITIQDERKTPPHQPVP